MEDNMEAAVPMEPMDEEAKPLEGEIEEGGDGMEAAPTVPEEEEEEEEEETPEEEPQM
jgi:hypothetical protein